MMINKYMYRKLMISHLDFDPLKQNKTIKFITMIDQIQPSLFMMAQCS